MFFLGSFMSNTCYGQEKLSNFSFSVVKKGLCGTTAVMYKPGKKTTYRGFADINVEVDKATRGKMELQLSIDVPEALLVIGEVECLRGKEHRLLLLRSTVGADVGLRVLST